MKNKELLVKESQLTRIAKLTYLLSCHQKMRESMIYKQELSIEDNIVDQYEFLCNTVHTDLSTVLQEIVDNDDKISNSLLDETEVEIDNLLRVKATTHRVN